MRKFFISAAVAASALTAVASPAAAQYYPQQGYAQQGYNQGYGYNQGNGYNQYSRVDARYLMARIDQVRQQIRTLARNRTLSGQEAYRLEAEANQLRQQVRQSAYNGIDQREQNRFQRQLQRLEQHVSYNANDRDGRYGRGSGFGGQYQYGQQNGDWNDRDGVDRDGDGRDRDRD